MRIPTGFQVFGRWVEVHLHEDHPEPTKYGHWDSQAQQIHLYAHGLSRGTIEHTFCHEMVHVLLDLTAQSELSKDEEYVDLLGGLLHQALDTFVGSVYDDEGDDD